MSIQELPWPPAYTIKRHRRAKRVKLRASKQRGLEITVPYRFKLSEIPAILSENKSWIDKQRLLLSTKQADELPNEIHLLAMNKQWSIHYQFCRAKLELILRPQGEMVLIGNTNDKMKCKTLLLNWIKQQAKHYLIAHLQAVSQTTGLAYAQAVVRDQATRWGSCTAKKNISLNYKLLFLPHPLATHVLIHELCHTQHLNHSSLFWQLVASHDPHWQTHRRELRAADKYLPAWL